MKQLLKELRACEEARDWAGDKTIEEIVATCHRGDWLLWLAAKVDIGPQPLTLAKGHCANTVRHLMKDERSVKAVDAAIAFGEGKAAIKELDNAADAAAYAAYAAADAAAADDDYCAYTADAADAAAYTAADAAADAAAADDADAAAYAAYAVAYAVARKENQLQTADICRKYIGQLIIEKVKNLKSQEDNTGE